MTELPSLFHVSPHGGGCARSHFNVSIFLFIWCVGITRLVSGISFRGSCSLHRFRTSLGKDEFRSLFQCHSAVEHAQTLLTSYILHTRAHQCAQESCGESPPWWPSTDSPREFISVAGGGGRNHRRLNGREVSARWGSVQSCSEKEKRRTTKRWAVLLEGDIFEEEKEGEWDGWERIAHGPVRLLRLEELSQERRQLREQEHDNLSPDCTCVTCLRDKTLGRTFRGRESQSSRKCEQLGEEGGRSRASGHGQSRQRWPGSPPPHPQSCLFNL